ncbi:MAG: RNA polymerase sigma factor, partial [Chloroflexota bacterium]|nr:RNA polymerase sigma factor [Chloroflexota bacterium]
MVHPLIDITSGLETALPYERTRLVRLCAKFTRDIDVAEDLAQETILEALRHEHMLRDKERRSQWLSGIARNVCLRWMRKQGRDSVHLISSNQDQDTTLFELEEWLADDFDVEVELEHKELAELLDKALTLLPAETRMILIKRYVDDSPLAEVAAQMGLNASAVAMRLQRGKLALRRVLSTHLRQDIVAYGYGITSSATHAFEQTSIWCPICGQNRLIGRFTPKEGELLLTCPSCRKDTAEMLCRTYYRELLSSVKG